MARKKKKNATDIAGDQLAQEQARTEEIFLKGVTTLRDLIAPSSIEIHSSYFRLGTKYGRTLYVFGYPRSIYTGWISSLVNIDEVIDKYRLDSMKDKIKDNEELFKKYAYIVENNNNLLEYIPLEVKQQDFLHVKYNDNAFCYYDSSNVQLSNIFNAKGIVLFNKVYAFNKEKAVAGKN